MKKEVPIDKKNITSKEFKLIEVGTDLVIFEGGYWMERKDYERVVFDEIKLSKNVSLPFRDCVIFDVDKETQKITYAFLPYD